MGSALSVSSPNPILPFVPEPPVVFQQFRLVSFPPRSCPKCPHSSPLLPTQHLHSQRGGRGSQKGKEQEGGLGRQEFKTNNKKQDQERRKKEKTTTKKQEALGADSTRKEKKTKKTRNQKDPFLEKKKKRKKFFALFQNFVVKLQDIGPCFQKCPNSLICFKCAFSASDRLFFGNCSRFLLFQLCHQFANLNLFFSNVIFAPN